MSNLFAMFGWGARGNLGRHIKRYEKDELRNIGLNLPSLS